MPPLQYPSHAVPQQAPVRCFGRRAMALLVSGLVSMTATAQTATNSAAVPLAASIAPVDLHTPSLRNQPNMSGTAAMVDANGDLHVLCVDPDWSESALRHAHAAERQPIHPIRFE